MKARQLDKRFDYAACFTHKIVLPYVWVIRDTIPISEQGVPLSFISHEIKVLCPDLPIYRAIYPSVGLYMHDVRFAKKVRADPIFLRQARAFYCERRQHVPV